MRDTGMPSCITSITACTAPGTSANGTTAAAIVSGTPYSRTVSSVITPSVPSEPTNRRVRS